MTPEHPPLPEIIQRLERRRMNQAGVALIMGSTILGAVYLMAPKVQTPTPIATSASTATSTPDAYKNITLTGRAAIVYDLSTHTVLYQKNAEAQLPLASLTKLLTIYAGVTTLATTTPVTIHAVAQNDAGDVGFQVGETFAFEDLARLALAASSNNAASAIADASAQSRSTSGVNLLAGAAAALGLAQTYAVNGTGLDENTRTAGGYGSAKDIALLSGALIARAPAIAEATIESTVTARSMNGTIHSFSNTNPDIVQVPDPLLSKTGFTDLAGGNLVVVFDAGIGHPVAVVVLGSTREGRFTDVHELISRTLSHFAGIAPHTP